MSAEKTKVQELLGREAELFALRLQKIEVDTARWELRYIDPESNEIWLMDFPDCEQHGGGPPRLRRL